MAKAYKIGEQMLTLSVIAEIITQGQQLELGKKAKQKIQACRDYLDDKMQKSDTPIDRGCLRSFASFGVFGLRCSRITCSGSHV